jgi:hypothetical protein
MLHLRFRFRLSPPLQPTPSPYSPPSHYPIRHLRQCSHRLHIRNTEKLDSTLFSNLQVHETQSQAMF